MNKYCVESLPENYVEAKTVDASNKKMGILLNLAALTVTVTGSFISALIIKPQDFFHNVDGVTIAVLCAILLSYIVLHELVHGAAYKIMTKRKLRFGVVSTAAFCGVPDIYVYRKCALISLFAPLTVFTVVFSAAVFLLNSEWHKFFCSVILFAHVGGCAGDIYGIVLLLAKYRDPATLMRDTGPKQTFYVPKK